MVYVGLASNTSSKLRMQTTDCGGIVLTFDIHMSTPLARRHLPPKEKGHNGLWPYPHGDKGSAVKRPPKSWALRATWGC